MDGQLKPKVTARVGYEPRPTSPFKQPATSLSPPLVRPKAKVNSSATIQPRKVANGAVSVSPSVRTAAPTRAPSPFKPPNSRVANGSASAGPAVKARLTARPNGSNPASPSTGPRDRAYTAATPTAISFPRERRVSASSSQLLGLGRNKSSASTCSSPARPTTALPDENTPTLNVNGVRVKAKVSRMADPNAAKSPPLNAAKSPPLPPSPRLANRPARVPSISNLTLSPPLMPSTSAGHSPSSTASSPLVPSQRFGSARETKHQSFQPISKAFHSFLPNDDTTINYSSGPRKLAAKVDPTTIPLPPQSPPTSTLSFSSRSSASASSVSYETLESFASRSTAPTLHSNVNGSGHVRQGSHSSLVRSNPESLGLHSPPITRDTSSTSDRDLSDDGDDYHESDDINDERKMKAEAKSNRKASSFYIADLEISNRSLLAINSSLEATKNRQAREIRELKRKLRESRLILPPPAYRAVKSSLTHDDTAEDDEEEEEEEGDDSEIVEGKADEAYSRVKVMLEGLIDSGRRALESKPEDFIGVGKGGAKVLTAEEVRTWRGEDEKSLLDVEVDNSSMPNSRPLTPSRVAVPDSDDDLGSEYEVEASLLEPDIMPLASLPPITVTSS